MRIAIVGTGIAGNVAARELARDHDITVFEADDRIGGHSHTVAVSAGGRDFAIDTGFIVYNERTYPRFTALLQELGVATQPSCMSFSVSQAGGGLEYCGTSLNALFAQRRNLLRPAFWGMLREILRFNRAAPALLDGPAAAGTLGDYLEAGGYSPFFIEHYLVPMGAAIWSASPADLRRMPARFFVRFFANHGLLQLRDRPQWRVIRGGSQRYVERLVAGHRQNIRLRAPVRWIRRHAGHVELQAAGTGPERYDQVFLACHSDQALRLLADPSPAERSVLGAIRYQDNEAVLHTDESLLPVRRRAWAAWNYHLPAAPGAGTVVLTYQMNLLQSLAAPLPFCVTLNGTERIDPARILHRIRYAHPVFTAAAVAAQQRQRELNGARRTYYCGAYWRYGFHEDGVVSAQQAVQHFRADRQDQDRHDHAQRALLRTG